MRSAHPSLPTRRRGDPVPIGDLLGLALPRRVQGRILDLDLIRSVWRSALPDRLARRAVPAALERRVVTIVAEDEGTAIEARRRRKEICERLLRAAGLPDAGLRLRAVARDRRNGAGG